MEVRNISLAILLVLIYPNWPKYHSTRFFFIPLDFTYGTSYSPPENAMRQNPRDESWTKLITGLNSLLTRVSPSYIPFLLHCITSCITYGLSEVLLILDSML